MYSIYILPGSANINRHIYLLF